MSHPPGTGGNDPSTSGLNRLFEDLVRDGWLMGMDVGMDPYAARMDPDTGTCNATHFRSLCEDAVRSRRDRRNRGTLAVVSVRLRNWEELCEGLSPEAVRKLATEVAVRIEGVLRIGDLVGRTRMDTFSLLLEDCSAPGLNSVAQRCAKVLEEVFEWSGVDRVASVEVGIAEWKPGCVGTLLQDSYDRLRRPGHH